MSSNQKEAVGANWQFRREITLGTLVQLILVLAMLAVGWSDLQSELVIIQHDLSQVAASQEKLQVHLKELTVQAQRREYRVRRLEEQM